MSHNGVGLDAQRPAWMRSSACLGVRWPSVTQHPGETYESMGHSTQRTDDFFPSSDHVKEQLHFARRSWRRRPASSSSQKQTAMHSCSSGHEGGASVSRTEPGRISSLWTGCGKHTNIQLSLRLSWSFRCIPTASKTVLRKPPCPSTGLAQSLWPPWNAMGTEYPGRGLRTASSRPVRLDDLASSGDAKQSQRSPQEMCVVISKTPKNGDP